jgi:2-phosphoglycolate phosphatase
MTDNNLTSPFPIQAIFFDLDGTLLDTAPDLWSALNQTLQTFDRTPIPFDGLLAHLYSSQAIIQFGFQTDETAPEYPKMLHTFLEIYEQSMAENTQLFPGMEQVLAYLDTEQIPWGVVTNKPKFLAEPLLKHFKLFERSKCVISGDSLPFKKPHPEPLYHACKTLGVECQKSVYIGDSEIDILTAKAAGLYSISVLYGYHSEANPPQKWNSDLLITKPSEIVDWLKQKNPTSS